MAKLKTDVSLRVKDLGFLIFGSVFSFWTLETLNA